MKLLKNGILIVFEGIDGSGKTTLATTVHQQLSHDFPVTLTREPGGSRLGKHIRQLLQEGIIPITTKAEYLLFAADRAQHVQEIIVPALQNKHIVISDRYADSSYAYQGYGRGLQPSMIDTVNTWATDTIKPTITFYVNISAQQALERRIKRGKAEGFDSASQDFFTKLIQGYKALYANRKDVITLDGTQSPEQLAQQAYSHIINVVEYD